MNKNKTVTIEESQRLEQIIQDKVNNQKAKWFYLVLYNQDYYQFEDRNQQELLDEAKFVLNKLESNIAYDLSMGDGNDWTITFELPVSFKERYVTINGYYSSNGDSDFSDVYYSSPYVHREVRYERKKVTVDATPETV